ncbi:sensor histidine kinase [Paenibacillus macerans]|uniref:cache domain-containing sensor histidine kinase n=1 Tax=Paenibacillus macerans TaxID=44252 RepID=UPI00203D7356|nr:sensor histidine kinase [Paenibacillus macerans]MCM3702116.1 sensor histidine kinase [Paenibacillus macerans]
MFLVRALNDMQLRKKLSLIFIAVSMIPLLISGVFLTAKLRAVMIREAFEQAESNVDRVKKRTEEVIKVPLDISYQLSNDSRMKLVAGRNYGSYIEVIQSFRQYTDIRDYMRLYKEVKGIRLYTPNPTILNNWEFMQPDAATEQSAWYRNALDQKGLAGWSYIEDERDQTHYLSLTRKITLDNRKQECVLVINVDSSLLNSILAQESFSTMIVDDDNNIVAANRPGMYGKNLSDVHVDRNVLTQAAGSFDAWLEGQPSKVVIASLVPQSSWNGLRIISVFSEAEIVKDTNRVIVQATIVIAASMLAAILLVYASASLITGRLLRLSKQMSKVGSGSWNTYLDIDGKDEIGQLSRQFNALVGRLGQLMSEVQETHRQKRRLEQKQNEIKFKMLASQINPHFLFNTLESIRMEAHLRGEEDISQAVWQLSHMIRSSLEIGNEQIPLKEELDMAVCYLELQKFRYEEKLIYELDIEPGAEGAKIPPLVIQPLVENSIIHGLENKEEGATLIRIHAGASKDKVMVEIGDDGAGMEPERLYRISRELSEPQETDGASRIGLRNVHDRLKLSYGEAYGLHLESKRGEGTRVSFFIPGGTKDVSSDDCG